MSKFKTTTPKKDDIAEQFKIAKNIVSEKQDGLVLVLTHKSIKSKEHGPGISVTGLMRANKINKLAYLDAIIKGLKIDPMELLMLIGQ